MIPRPISQVIMNNNEGGKEKEEMEELKQREEGENENEANNATAEAAPFILKQMTGIQGSIINGLTLFFYWQGKTVGSYPKSTICLSLFVLFACLPGLAFFKKETNMIKLWIPKNSNVRVNTDWLNRNYPSDFRFASMIFVHEDNILTADNIRTIYNVRKKVTEIRLRSNNNESQIIHSWDRHCQKLPVLKAPNLLDIISSLLSKKRRRRKRDTNQEFFDNIEFFDDDYTSPDEDAYEDLSPIERAEKMSVENYPDPYCKVVQSMSEACFEMSLLELFASDGSYQDHVFESLTDQKVIDVVNSVNKSGIFYMDRDINDFIRDTIIYMDLKHNANHY